MRYRGGVLVSERPLDPREEGEELLVRIAYVGEKRRILEKYRGILGHVEPEHVEEVIEEAEHL